MSPPPPPLQVILLDLLKGEGDIFLIGDVQPDNVICYNLFTGASQIPESCHKSYSRGRWTWPAPLKSPESKSPSPSPQVQRGDLGDLDLDEGDLN